MSRTPCSVQRLLRAASLGLALATGLTLHPAPAKASSVVHLSPEKVLAQADVIFQGTVVSSVYGWTDQRHIFATTEYTLRIDRVVLDREGWLAARTTGGNTVLSFMGGQQAGVNYIVSGMPKLVIGESAFFFMNGDDLRNNAMSPVIGDSEGLFRLAPLNGQMKVFTPGGCSGPPRPVDFRFFTKFREANATYTADQFAAEIARALPFAAASPELRVTGGGIVPAHLAGQALGPGQFNTQTVGTSQPVAAGPNVIPADPNAPMGVPVPPGPRNFVEAAVELIEPPEAPAWGFPPDTDPPEYPVVFNVPPVMSFRNAFIEEEARWNRYSSGAFRLFANNDNSIGWPNGRYETGYLNNQQMIDLYGRGWGANTLARCISREGAFTDRIVEADIAFNPAQVFSDQQAVVYGNASVNSFRTTALHELGHAFGRVHAWESNPGSVYPSCLNYSASGFYDAESGRVFADDSESFRAAFQATAVYSTDFGITLWRNSGTLAPFTFNPDGTTSLSVNGVTGLTMPPSVLQGAFFSIFNIWLENIGTVTRSTTIDWYLDPTPYDFNLSDAFYCSSTSLGTLARYNGVAVSTFVPAPQNIPPGNYYLCAVAEGTNEAITDNNFAWSQNTIRVDFNSVLNGPPANDSRSTPQSIGLGSFTGSTVNATSGGSASCGLSNTSPDVWFTFVAPYSGSFSVDTCQGTGYDTVLSVEQRQLSPSINGGFFYTEIGCNDDAQGVCAGSNRSRVVINSVSAGTVLRIRLAGYNGARGPYTLRTQLDPANDFCSNAVEVSAGTYTATLAGASNDMTGTCGQSVSTPDVWFRYTWPVGCNSVTFNTVGSNFDTVLEAFNVCSPFATSRGCNDDCQGLTSCLTIVRGAEERIRIRVSHYGQTPLAGTSIVLNVSTPAPSNDTCLAAPLLGDGDYAFNNNCANTDQLPMPSSCGSSAAVNDFWFFYTAPVTGQLQVTVNAAFPAAVALYPGFACPGDPEQAIACGIGFDGVAGIPGAALAADVSAGETFLIRIGGSVQPGFGTPIGPGTFSFHTVQAAPANNDAQLAAAVFVGDRINANLSLASPDGASSADRVAGGPDVWFAFTAPANGVLNVRTCQTLLNFGLDTVASIHAIQPDYSILELAASDTFAPAPCTEGLGADFEDASVSLTVESGALYLIRIAATDPALIGTGQFNLEVDFNAPNDDCSTPGTLVEGDNIFSTAGASPASLAHDIFDGTEPDVWFFYSPTCTGVARISTCSQPYDTKLAVYITGCPLAEELPIASNNDDGIECAGAAASLEFPCAAGATYMVRVAGDIPSLQIISVTCTPDAHLADVCGNGNTVTDIEPAMLTTFAATADGLADSCFDGTERDVWYTYTATCTGSVRLSFCGDETDSKLAVYLGIDCPTGEPIACNDNDGPACPGLAASLDFAATIDTIYQFRIALADDLFHSLTITCTPGGGGNPVDFNDDGIVSPDDLDEFITTYFSEPPDNERADFNNDGIVSPDDLDEFITAYFEQ